MLASVIQVFEIYRVIRRDLSEEKAIESVAALQRSRIVEVDTSLALEAAELTFEYRLAMADALIYATARRHDAKLVTGDADFNGLPGTVVVR